MLYCARSLAPSLVALVWSSACARSLQCTLVARAAAQGTRDRSVAKNQLCCIQLVVLSSRLSSLSVLQEKAARTGNRKVARLVLGRNLKVAPNPKAREGSSAAVQWRMAMKGGVDLDSDPVVPVVVNSPGAGGGGRRLLLPT